MQREYVNAPRMDGTAIVERIRKFFKARPDLKVGTFATKAKLHRNSLYGMHDDGWNPTRETLDKCVATMDAIEAEEAKARKQRPRRSPMRAAACLA